VTASQLADSSGSAQGRDDPALRILAVGNMYPPHHAGGYELMWQAAVEHARQRGHRVRVLTSEYRASADVPDSDPEVYRTLRWYWDLERYEFPKLGLLERLGIERANATELDRHLQDLQPDVVSWWNMGCMSLSLIERVRRRGIPAVFIVHDDWLIYGRRFDQWIRMWRGARRLLAGPVELLSHVPTRVDLAAAGDFVFNSHYTLEAARQAGVPLPTARVVHPGIEPDIQRPLPEDPWDWRLLYIGRIDRQKGIDTALQALPHLPALATLDVWGTGDEEYLTQMRELAAQLGLEGRVSFHGWAGPQERLQAYRKADVVVFPVRWEEPFGLVPLEAMATGRPVVSTVRGGSAEFLRPEENALVFEPDDAVALAEQVGRIAHDEGLRRRLVAAGHETAAGFTLERFTEGTVRQIVAAARR
jgi:glycogen synthase